MQDPVIHFAGSGSGLNHNSHGGDEQGRGQGGGKRGRGGQRGAGQRPASAVASVRMEDTRVGEQQLSWQQRELMRSSLPDRSRRPKKDVTDAAENAAPQGNGQQQGSGRPGQGQRTGQQRSQSARAGASEANGVLPQQQQQPQRQPPPAAMQPQLTGSAQAAGASSSAYVSKPVNNTALQHQSNVRFSSLEISPITKKAMAEVFCYEFCTKVQAQSLPACLSGQDVLAKAKTGTGKTLAFMIPALENLLRNPPRLGQVGVLVLSPTRELAMQIHTETEKLATFMTMSVQVVIGGTNMNAEAKKLAQRTPHVLVATPGRCLDHLTNESSSLGSKVKELRVLIFDEADNLLDMGFRPTIDKILLHLPSKNTRQTLLFSATFPANVQQLASYAFRPAYATVDTVGAETGTNVQVEQLSCVVEPRDLMLYLCAVIKTHMQQDPEFKIIVFFPTARQTQLYSETFEAMGIPIKEMHSRKSQGYRTRVSEEFRAGSGVVMFSSDVSARGVDYPDVSLVVQVGLPSDRDQYVHRVGRTARAGKTGQSLLLLADFEAFFLNKLKDLPLRNMGRLSPAIVQAEQPALTAALSRVPAETKSMAYAAFLGFYKSAPGLSMSPAQVVETANEFSRIIGCHEPPEIEAKTVGKMGLKGVPGIRIAGRNPPGGGGGADPGQQYGRVAAPGYGGQQQQQSRPASGRNGGNFGSGSGQQPTDAGAPRGRGGGGGHYGGRG